MAVAKLLLPSSSSSSSLLPSKWEIRSSSSRIPSSPYHLHPWGLEKKKNKNIKSAGVGVVASLASSSTLDMVQELFVLADVSGGGYSSASYYTSLGLFVISVPGLWSLIKRSVKSKVVKKTFVQGTSDVDNIVVDSSAAKTPNQVAGEIMSFFTRNNFSVVDRGDTITFEGVMVPSRGQAALLTFCTCISLASVALVLTITAPDFGNYWFGLTLFSPLAGLYYWKRASRKEQIKVRLMLADQDNGQKLSEIIVQGDDQQLDQMRRELNLSEKGMVYVKGIFER